jgi:hypothetical protein
MKQVLLVARHPPWAYDSSDQKMVEFYKTWPKVVVEVLGNNKPKTGVQELSLGCWLINIDASGFAFLAKCIVQLAESKIEYSILVLHENTEPLTFPASKA